MAPGLPKHRRGQRRPMKLEQECIRASDGTRIRVEGLRALVSGAGCHRERHAWGWRWPSATIRRFTRRGRCREPRCDQRGARAQAQDTRRIAARRRDRDRHRDRGRLAGQHPRNRRHRRERQVRLPRAGARQRNCVVHLPGDRHAARDRADSVIRVIGSAHLHVAHPAVAGRPILFAGRVLGGLSRPAGRSCSSNTESRACPSTSHRRTLIHTNRQGRFAFRRPMATNAAG